MFDLPALARAVRSVPARLRNLGVDLGGLGMRLRATLAEAAVEAAVRFARDTADRLLLSQHPAPPPATSEPACEASYGHWIDEPSVGADGVGMTVFSREAPPA